MAVPPITQRSATHDDLGLFNKANCLIALFMIIIALASFNFPAKTPDQKIAPNLSTEGVQ